MDFQNRISSCEESSGTCACLQKRIPQKNKVISSSVFPCCDTIFLITCHGFSWRFAGMASMAHLLYAV